MNLVKYNLPGGPISGVHYNLGTREDAFVLAHNALAAVQHVQRDELNTEFIEALSCLLEQTVDQDLKHGFTLTEGEEDARRKALAVIARAAV